MKNKTQFVILGATGDLVSRKIIPALYYLMNENKLGEDFNCIAFARRDLSNNEYYKFLKESLSNKFKEENPLQNFENFCKSFEYVQGNFTDIDSFNKLYEKIDKEKQTIFYLATPQEFYDDIIFNIENSKISEICKESDTKIIIEKPFGDDEKTALKLNNLLLKYFNENQIYRIDHYLGKEIIRSLPHLLSENKEIKRFWNLNNIQSVKISFLEDLDVADRGEFYDKTGALKDMGQNHLLVSLSQLFVKHDDNTSNYLKERANVIENLHHVEDVGEQTIRAQYKGYRDVENVSPDSQTETYFKINTNYSSSNIPIILESGKKLIDEKIIEINLSNNKKIVIQLEPMKMQSIRIENGADKKEINTSNKKKKFQYVEEYANLLTDCFNSNQKYFVSIEEIIAAWKFIDPIIFSWKKNKESLKMYDSNNLPTK